MTDATRARKARVNFMVVVCGEGELVCDWGGRPCSVELVFLRGVAVSLSTSGFLHRDSIFPMAHESDYEIPAMSALALHAMYRLQRGFFSG